MTTFKPMLASNSKPEDIKEPNLGSIKLEGVRGEFTPEGLLTRQLKDFNNELLYQREDVKRIEQFCLEHNMILEGEWYLHGWTFKRIDSCLRGNGNIDVNQLEFHVFDCYVPEQSEATFTQRVSFYKWAVEQLHLAGVEKIVAVQQTLMQGADDIRNAYIWALENGYEGFCLKKADGPYKLGRSTLKQELFTRIKPEDPYDGVVLGIIERQSNLCESEVNELGYLAKKQNKDMKAPTGMAQTAVVYTPALGKLHKVSLTLGLTDADRARIWDERNELIGKCIKWIGIPVPGQDIPRSPRFKEWRNDLDPSYLVHHESECLDVSWEIGKCEEWYSGGGEGCSLMHFLDCIANKFTLGKG